MALPASGGLYTQHQLAEITLPRRRYDIKATIIYGPDVMTAMKPRRIAELPPMRCLPTKACSGKVIAPIAADPLVRCLTQRHGGWRAVPASLSAADDGGIGNIDHLLMPLSPWLAA